MVLKQAHVFAAMSKRVLSISQRAKCMFRTVANGTLPRPKYICSQLKSKVSILRSRKVFRWEWKNIAAEDQGRILLNFPNLLNSENDRLPK